jgi:hypothetical protein
MGVLMSNYIWGTFAVLMVGVATGLYLLGYRWYDHDVNAIGALLVLIVMGAIFANSRKGRWK